MTKPWQHISNDQISAATSIFTLLDDEEQRMLFHYGALVGGAGCIVDLGCHLGGSTARIALGAKAAHFSGDIHLFDRFMVKYPLSKLLERTPQHLTAIADVDDTQPLVKGLLEPIGANFVLHNGEFMEFEWPGEKVELLFVDIGKNLRTMDHVATQFYPSLIPNQSVIIQQDYQYKWNPWISVHCEIWADKFEYLAHTESESVIFKLTSKITKEETLERQMVDLGDDELKALFEKARARFANTTIAHRLDEMAQMIGDAPFPRRTIGKKFIRLKDRRFTEDEAAQLREAQRTSGINARRKMKRENRDAN